MVAVSLFYYAGNYNHQPKINEIAILVVSSSSMSTKRLRALLDGLRYPLNMWHLRLKIH